MAKPAELEKLTGLASRFGAFVAERHPFALADALDAFEAATGGARAARRGRHRSAAPGASARARAAAAGARRCRRACPTPRRGPPPAARIGAGARRAASTTCDGFLRRAAIEASLTRDERVEILRGMVLTRATDNRLKAFFTGGEVRYGARVVSGQGLPLARPGSDLRGRHPAAARRGVPRRRRPLERRRHRAGDSRPRRRRWRCAPSPSTVRMVLNAQMGKAGAPLEGKDLHIGDFEWGILPPAAPLTIATLTIAGMAMAFWRDGSGRVARLVHRRRRVVARRMARGDQPVRRAAAAGDLLRREQPDRAVDAGRRAVGRARVRRQGGRLRHSRHHDRRHRSRRRSPRRSPGPPSGRARGRGRR